MKSKEFLAAFDEELFAPGLEAASKDAALAAMVALLHAKKRVNSQQAVLGTLIEREKLGSTGIGKGVAIPHSRSMTVERLTVAFASLSAPIEFDSIDKKPVNLLFLILAPPQDVGNEYLPFIGRLVEVVKEKKNRDALKGVTSFSQFREVMEKGLA